MFKQKLYAGLIGGVLMLGLTLSTPAMAGKDLTEAEVPEGAKNWFQKTYPKATKVEWEQKKVNIGKRRGETLYEVEFTDEYDIDHEVKLTADGQLVKGDLD
ncbi:MAG: hypothetical protein ACXW1Z_15350 [Methylobacter sp.]